MILLDDDWKKLHKELSPSEIRDLESLHEKAPERYIYYRKSWPRWTVEKCYDHAVAWAMNTTDQSHRRKAHMTGAT